VSPNTGRNDTAMMRSEKKIAGVTSRAASARSFSRSSSGRSLGGVLELLVGGLHHDDLGVDGGADRDGDAAERHDGGGTRRSAIGMKAATTASGSEMMGGARCGCAGGRG
jgi:hypothetical protein